MADVTYYRKLETASWETGRAGTQSSKAIRPSRPLLFAWALAPSDSRRRFNRSCQGRRARTAPTARSIELGLFEVQNRQPPACWLDFKITTNSICSIGAAEGPLRSGAVGSPVASANFDPERWPAAPHVVWGRRIVSNYVPNVTKNLTVCITIPSICSGSTLMLIL